MVDTLDPLPRLPTGISLGASGGPGFKTTIAPGDRGPRSQAWQEVRGVYDVSFTIKDDSQIAELLTFFRTRRGRAYPFRFKDWSDYQLPDPGDDLLFSDLFETDGSTALVQIVKVYQDTAGVYTRNICRPVHGTVTLYDDGVFTADYTVNYTNGVITLGDTLKATTGHVVSIACEFDVKARFDTDEMIVTISSFGVHSWQNVSIIELHDG